MTSGDLPPAARAAIVAKTGSTISLTLAWERAARKALVAGVDEARLLFLIERLAHARSLEHLLAVSAPSDATLVEFIDDLVSRANETEFSVEDWVAAFEKVQRSVIQQSRAAQPAKMLGYVQCSADFASTNEARFSLAEIVEEMLANYGF